MFGCHDHRIREVTKVFTMSLAALFSPCEQDGDPADKACIMFILHITLMHLGHRCTLQHTEIVSDVHPVFGYLDLRHTRVRVRHMDTRTHKGKRLMSWVDVTNILRWSNIFSRGLWAGKPCSGIIDCYVDADTSLKIDVTLVGFAPRGSLALPRLSSYLSATPESLL